ncbi:MAG: bifunctional 4-hydroxy-2-oxoglutarate aldolase/2-dehydro-3-deoxy-phosphogluconate aldolase [Thermoflexales bacterium]|nr:bifunctional 4-hydroxy-2-oxoglutarate aldolase/2-dehydro-3-deoxy-phosphogluconate aldolase [Thermoflexales bacterium]
MDAQQAKSIIEAGRVIAILRGDYSGYFRPIARALAEAGIRAVEVTLNSPGALDGLHEMRDELGDRFLLGAGTVLNKSQALEAIAAGAQFIVAPNTNPRVVEICVERDICVIPGAYTPTEIMNAVELGAHLIKLFPADLGYFKAVRAPLNHVPFVATGGVSLDNAAEYIKAGAVAVGMGSQLIGEYVKQDGGLRTLGERARRLAQSLGLEPQSVRETA